MPLNTVKEMTPCYPDIARVHMCDSRFAPWLDKICKITVPDILTKFEKDGAINNYERVAAGLKGGHGGPPWFHGLICECIRGISDLLVLHYDADIDARLDKIIDSIARAQAADPENYINPYTTLMCPDKRWGRNGGNIRWQHETYDAGCLAEAGVHHYIATGKTTLLSVAVKMCNYLADFIGDAPKKNVVAEHSLPEEAFTKLYLLLKDNAALSAELGAKPEEYLRVAKFFIDHKGDNETRYTFPPFNQEYAQDHRPAREQREAVGHAVRATLFYTGMAAVALETDDVPLAEACRTIWDDVVQKKLHANGCVGAIRNDEKFGQQYELPNDAYLETCAGVGLGFWGCRLFRLYPEASIWDTVENMVYNLLPASLSDTCDHYTYENPLETRGGYERWSWHGCPCCPPMFLKFVGGMHQLIFAQTKDGGNIWLNLYIDSELDRDDCTILLKDGKLTVTPKGKDAISMTLRLRIPEWARNYRLTRNGAEADYKIVDGYAVISGEFTAADEIGILYDTPIVKYEAHPYVGADHGRVIVKHGAVLYCAESIDNGTTSWEDLDFEISADAGLKLCENGNITGNKTDGTPFTLIKYYTWNNRGAHPMRVWFRQSGLVSDPMNTEGWEGKLYRPCAEYEA